MAGNPSPFPVTLTDRAAGRICHLIDQADDDVIALRLGVKGSGCAGLAYKLDYATQNDETHDLLEDKGAKVFIESDAMMFLIGCEIDFVQEDLGARFVFKNPNEVGRCGCGESFYVEA